MTDLGLSSKQFWNLTWYEWGLLVLRYIKDGMRRRDEDEFRMELTGRFMALFATVNSKKEWTRQDFFKLSYDKKIVDERPITFKEAKQMVGSKFKKDGK